MQELIQVSIPFMQDFGWKLPWALGVWSRATFLAMISPDVAMEQALGDGREKCPLCLQFFGDPDEEIIFTKFTWLQKHARHSASCYHHVVSMSHMTSHIPWPILYCTVLYCLSLCEVTCYMSFLCSGRAFWPWNYSGHISPCWSRRCMPEMLVRSSWKLQDNCASNPGPEDDWAWCFAYQVPWLLLQIQLFKYWTALYCLVTYHSLGNLERLIFPQCFQLSLGFWFKVWSEL